MTQRDLIRVLVIDDSAFSRQTITHMLRTSPLVEVVGVARDGEEALRKTFELLPDLITLDREMPRMDGLSFLAKLMKHHPIPVVIVSSLVPENSETALRALQLGAVDVIPKPGSQFSIPDVRRQPARAVRPAAQAKLTALRADAADRPAPPPSRPTSSRRR